MPKKKRDEGSEIPEWVVTYGDLMSLLLCFFILLAAFSELKEEREYRKVLESIQEALGFRGGLGIADLDYPVMNNMTNRQNDRANYSDQMLDADDNINSNVVGRNNRTSVVHEGSMLAIGGSIPFEPGEYALTPSARDAVRDEIAPKIAGQNYVVYVIGHAWGEQEELSGFDAGELAFRRADAVAEYMVRECGVDPLILRVMSAGAQEPASLSTPGVESASPNRRVQVWQTGRTVDQTHPDPNYTSAGVP
ncbi:MAG: flagellar motor protein MotB [Phycisphaerales bacterium JB040]